APARIRRSAVSMSSQCAAQASAVAPSDWGVFTSTCCCSKERTASWFRPFAASTSRRSPPAAAKPAIDSNGASHQIPNFLILTFIFVPHLAEFLYPPEYVFPRTPTCRIPKNVVSVPHRFLASSRWKSALVSRCCSLGSPREPPPRPARSRIGCASAYWLDTGGGAH